MLLFGIRIYGFSILGMNHRKINSDLFRLISRERGWSSEDVLASGISAAYSAAVFTQVDARIQARKNNKNEIIT